MIKIKAITKTVPESFFEIHPHKQLIFVWQRSGHLCIYNLRRSRLIKRQKQGGESVNALKINWKGTILAAGFVSGAIIILSTLSFTVIK